MGDAQHRALAEKLATAAAQGVDLWVVTSTSDKREDIPAIAVALQAAWGRAPVNALLVHAPSVRPQPFVHAGGTDAHLLNTGDLQDQLNGALQRAMALNPEHPLEAAVEALSTEFTILGRRLERLRQRNLAALATVTTERPAPPVAMPRWADSFAIPAIAIVVALGSLVALVMAILRHTRAGKRRYFPTAAFRTRFDAPFSGGSNFVRDLPRSDQ